MPTISGGKTIEGAVPRPTKQAANADTSAATLAALETEVNEVKAALRAAGIIA